MAVTSDVRRGRHAEWDLHAHLVFVTKYRRRVFTEEILGDLEEVMRSVCVDFGCELEEFHGGDNHVHLLVRFPATVELSKLVNSLKGVSSRRVRQRHGDHLQPFLWAGHLWSRSYYAGTAGAAGMETVRRYIEQQNRSSPS